MPKTSRDFPNTLNISVSLDMKQKMVAAGYMMMQKGEYADSCRNFLLRGYMLWLDNLTERERKDFDEILANVRISVTK